MQQDGGMVIPSASVPGASVEVPDRVRELARGAALTPVWLNGIGGLTFRTDDGRYIKWGPLDLEASMRDEAERMRWARRWIAAPEVIEQGENDVEEWLVTVALDARSAVDPRWKGEPELAVRAVGEALRALHDALPVDACPWEWSVETRIANAAEREVLRRSTGSSSATAMPACRTPCSTMQGGLPRSSISPPSAPRIAGRTSRSRR
jgi:kanamycin kinase